MRTAVVQINSGPDRDLNIEAAGRQVSAAAADGAAFVVLPEKWPRLAPGEQLVEGAEPVDGPAMTAARQWAKENAIHLLAGSFTELSPDGLPTNTSILIGPGGDDLATYRKVHMFDVDVGGVSYRESAFERAGDQIVTARVGEAELGMSICYDLRFPGGPYRALVDRGANLFAIPAAFTSTTGRDHWEVLLRARAIENQAFVLAANQHGKADPEYDSWGHSMIVDPWGRILDQISEGEGFAIADLDYAERQRVTETLPALDHRRPGMYGDEKGAA